MLDIVTLRVVFGLVALCVMVLFYAATYRSTKAPFSGWWILALGLYLVSAGLYLFNGTSLQVIANPTANALGIAGSGAVWAAAASLRGRALPALALLVPTLLVLAVSLADDPTHDVWTGGPLYLAGIAAFYALTARELFTLWGTRERGAAADASHSTAVFSMAVLSAFVAIFYTARWTLFLTVGPDAALFQHLVGSEATTLIMTLLLVTVTFTMSQLAHGQQVTVLRIAADHDPLTGLLNRSGFAQRVNDVLANDPEPERWTLVMSDFDDFKRINDRYGHGTGDAALAAFGDICRTVLGPHDLAARLGGDEFALLIRRSGDHTPDELVADLNRRLMLRAVHRSHPMTTVTFGFAVLDIEAGLEVSLARADEALYRAKRSGTGLHDCPDPA